MMDEKSNFIEDTRLKIRIAALCRVKADVQIARIAQSGVHLAAPRPLD